MCNILTPPNHSQTFRYLHKPTCMYCKVQLLLRYVMVRIIYMVLLYDVRITSEITFVLS